MSILTQDTEETSERSMEGTVREPVVRAFRMALEDAEMGGASGSKGSGLARTFLLIDLGAAVGYLLGNRGSKSGNAGAIAEMVSEPASQSRTEIGTEQQSGGRSTLSKLFLLGAVVGIGYVLRTRMGSMDRAIDEATERARTVADETAMRSGEIAGRTETVSRETADRLEGTSETAAERVEEAGEMAADEIEKAGETVEEAEQQMEEQAEEMTEGGKETDEESEE
jgi:hypothetical protein